MSPISPSAKGRGASQRVALCAEVDSLRDRALTALEDGGHRVVAAEGNTDALVRELEGIGAQALVVACSRADRVTVEGTLAAAEALRADCHIMITDRAGDAEVRRALQLGIGGVVLAADIDRALAAAVAVVGAGQVCVPDSQRATARGQVLTTREKQILSLVVMGMTNAEISRKLYLAESTVKSHLSSAFSKLGVGSRNEAVRVILDPDLGRALGILTIPAERIPSPG
jgi:DNA-binding NarL/FixJ family response regulator